ncbi:MAG: hypothetical protein J0M18_14640 [Ignavibacteria bacterium]|nr:hypothetical protein [Ignavibacteria bacterium]
MKNEISELLQGISKEEFERFGDFIKSPYFNKLPRLIKLYDYLNKNYNKLEQEIITRESISIYMYPGKEFKNESIRKLLSDFARMLERFLAQEEFEQNEWDKRIYTLRGLRKKHYDDKFFKRLKEFKAEHKNSIQEIDEYYETNTKLISEEFEYRFASKFNDRNEINQEKSDALDYEFISKKLFLFQYMKSREYVNKNLIFRFDFFNEIKDFFNNNKDIIKIEQPLLYQSFLGITLVFNNFQEKDMLQVKDFLESQKFYTKKISKPYWEYINYCAVFTNRNNNKYWKEILFYLRLMEEKKMILENGELLHYYFKTAFDAALYEKEFDWLEKFINHYGSKIKHNFKKDMINLSHAKLSLARNEVLKSKEYANKITFKDYLHYIAAKKILLRIAYEEEDFNAIISIIDTIRKYFSSHDEIPEVYRAGTEEFMQYVLRLSKIRENNSLGENVDFELVKFRTELKEESREVSFSDWLLEKTFQFKK